LARPIYVSRPHVI